MKKLKIGVVGLNFGKNILRQLASNGAKEYFELAALCDLDREKVERLAAEQGVKAYTSIDDMLKDEELEVIGLYTGPWGRAGLLDKIISSGRDVMTTKPFEMEVAEARRVLEKADKLKRIIHMNSPCPEPDPFIRQVHKWVDEYNLGRPIACRSDYWRNTRDKDDGRWYGNPEKCPAAPILRLGIYQVNDLIRLFGRVSKVQVLQSRIFTPLKTSDNAQMGILFENGAIANIMDSFCINDAQRRRFSMTINYQNGTIYNNVGPTGEDGSVQWGELTLVTPGKNGEMLVVNEKSQSSRYQWDVFYKAVIERIPMATSYIGEILEGVKVMQAMSEASKTDKTVCVQN